MTTLPPDHGELWKALREAWIADPLISQLIASTNQGGSIYRAFPHNKVDFPLLVLNIDAPAINTEASFLGVSRENFRINSFSTDRYFGDKVFAAFQQNWSIPRTAVEFQTENWRVTDMTWRMPIDLGSLRPTNADQDLWEFACLGHCYVRRRDS